MEMVGWDDLQVFLAEQNEVGPERDSGLPTEADWEYACRAGTTGDYGGSFVLDQMGWCNGSASAMTYLVARKQANAGGRYDMHGKVYEWVEDRYSESYYAVSPLNDPAGPEDGSPPATLRAIRGGDWGDGVIWIPVANRGAGVNSSQGNHLGCRLAWTPS